jgi:hypothetical protein
LNTPSNSSRDMALGPGGATLDLSLAEQFPVNKHRAAEIRLEAFNSLNHTNFGESGHRIRVVDLGAISSAGSPRIVQMAIRFRF